LTSGYYSRAAIPSAWTTAQYDNGRTGANPHETTLTPRNVNAGQPTAPLWQVSFLNPKAGVNPVPVNVVRCSFIGPEIGITPTPVIDAANRTMYVLARTAERARDGEDRYYQRLHSLDITTGAERPGSPVLIRASVKTTSLFGLIQSEITFHALLENPRAALLLSGGNVYIAWGSSCDVGPYYGWVLAYNARTLQQTGVFNTSPGSGESGIWRCALGSRLFHPIQRKRAQFER
jgi:hypothetical protein